MASRCEIVDEEYIKELKDKSENKIRGKALSTRRTTTVSSTAHRTDCLKVMQALLERYLKSKAYPKSIIQDSEFLNSRKDLEGKAKETERTGQRKATKSIRKFDKRRGKSTLVAASLERELQEFCLTPCGSCSLSTLAYEGEKNTTK